MLHHKSMLLKLENIIVFTIYLLFQGMKHPQCAVPLFLQVASVGGAKRVILSVGGAEKIILSAGGAESMMLSACAKSMIVSAPPAESMILLAPFHCVIMLTAVQRAAKKNQQSAILTITNLQLWSLASQRRCRLVCRQRWPSFATLPTDC
jgi:hypothetical protein